ncbi:transcription antitermination factor NusB [Limosilactobacillus difficilis]|uniref:transcription antitermination factor NusB n=1 Tax=Limosilactobacillus difficilis TaxID=2991838 RepID=UPI0024BA0FCD|nr:transcription antitermination factor NusB [Limosilactobacillus difficilis]
METTRHKIRETAFQTLFALESTPDADRDTIYQNLLHLKEGQQAPAYLGQLVNGVLEHKDTLDQQISGLLASGWTIERLVKADLVILRLGLYELQYEQSLPTAVAINEALELARTFSDEKSRKFINGVLGNFVKQHKN